MIALDNLLLQDLPNHVARAVIIGELLFNQGSAFEHWFRLVWQPAPYAFGDLMLVALVQALGPDWGGKVWAALSMLALPGAMYLCLRRARLGIESVLIGVLVSLWISTNWFFLSGFVHFQFAIAASILTILTGYLYLRNGHGTTYLLFFSLIVVGYFLHLATYVFALAGLGVVALLQVATPLRVLAGRLLRLAVPIVIVAIWHVSASLVMRETSGGVYSAAKLSPKKLLFPFLRYDMWFDFAVAMLFFAVISVPLFFVRKPGWKLALADERVRVAAALAIAFFVLYLVMPTGTLGMSHVDVRVLPSMWVFALICALLIYEFSELVLRNRGKLLVAALVLSACNLALLGFRWVELSFVATEYRKVVSQIQPGSIVLPVLTREGVGAVNAYAHLGSYALIDARSLTPYVFSSPEMAPHVKYFVARRLLPAGRRPDQWWYRRDKNMPESVEVAREYDAIIATKPFDSTRLGIDVRPIYENTAAVLLQPQVIAD